MKDRHHGSCEISQFLILDMVYNVTKYMKMRYVRGGVNGDNLEMKGERKSLILYFVLLPNKLAMLRYDMATVLHLNAKEETTNQNPWQQPLIDFSSSRK